MKEEAEGGMSAKLLPQLYHCAARRVPVLCCQVLSGETEHKGELDTGDEHTKKIYAPLYRAVR